MLVVVDDGVGVIVGTGEDECNEVVYTVTVLNNHEMLTIILCYLLVSDSVYGVLVTSAVEYVTDVQYCIKIQERICMKWE